MGKTDPSERFDGEFSDVSVRINKYGNVQSRKQNGERPPFISKTSRWYFLWKGSVCFVTAATSCKLRLLDQKVGDHREREREREEKKEKER